MVRKKKRRFTSLFQFSASTNTPPTNIISIETTLPPTVTKSWLEISIMAPSYIHWCSLLREHLLRAHPFQNNVRFRATEYRAQWHEPDASAVRSWPHPTQPTRLHRIRARPFQEWVDDRR